MSSGFNPEYSDVMSDAYAATTISVSTSQVEAKVGASSLSGRESLTVYNGSSKTIWYGPTGFTTSSGGIPIFKDQTVMLPAGEDNHVFLITSSGTATGVVIQEWA